MISREDDSILPQTIHGYSYDIESTQVRYSYSGSRYYVDVRAICIIWGLSRGGLATDDDQHGTGR